VAVVVAQNSTMSEPVKLRCQAAASKPPTTSKIPAQVNTSAPITGREGGRRRTRAVHNTTIAG